MRHLNWLLLTLVLGCSSTTDPSQPISGEGEPFLDVAAFLPTLKQSLPPPPQNTLAQTGEVRTLLRLQKSRKKADCERASTEVESTLGNFFGPPHGPLKAEQVTKLNTFFIAIRKSSGPFIGKLKAEHPRPRPFTVIKGLVPCAKPETSPSYPSGHGFMAEVYARVLIDLFPNLQPQIRVRTDVIGEDRVLAGVHYPSDVAVGRAMGQRVYEEMLKSEKYQTAFQSAKASLTATH